MCANAPHFTPSLIYKEQRYPKSTDVNTYVITSNLTYKEKELTKTMRYKRMNQRIRVPLKTDEREALERAMEKRGIVSMSAYFRLLLFKDSTFTGELNGIRKYQDYNPAVDTRFETAN